MSRRVVFYDKGTGGHRLPIQTVLREHLKPSGYTFDIAIGVKGENSFIFLRELAQKQRFDHCHILTLDDCLQDFESAREDIGWFEKAGISFSGTYYLFTDLSPHLWWLAKMLNRPHVVPYLLLKYRRLMAPGQAERLRAVSRMARSNIVSDILIPDERLSSRFRYPFWRNKLRFRPDPAIFASEPADRASARKELGWENELPTVLMFGQMTDWKGLDILAESLSESYSHLYARPFRVVLAGQQYEKRLAIPLSPGVELVELDMHVENDMAKMLFAAADCVVMPYKKHFVWSSGTFSLACSSGKFVIVPDSGLMAWRVRKWNNGLVYRADSPASLARAISRFVSMYRTLSYPIAGSVQYARTCTPTAYARIVDEVVADLTKAGERMPGRT